MQQRTAVTTESTEQDKSAQRPRLEPFWTSLPTYDRRRPPAACSTLRRERAAFQPLCVLACTLSPRWLVPGSRVHEHGKRTVNGDPEHNLGMLPVPIGSGPMESAIRRVINMRLKGPGIFWHEDTAEAMIMIRAYYKAQRWQELLQLACSTPIEALR